MSVAVSNDYTGFPTYGVRRTYASGNRTGAQALQANAQEGTADTVRLSGNGRLAASGLLDGLILPTEENVQKLSAALSRDLGGLLKGLGISSNPPIEFSTGSSGEIQIKGDRPDKERILEAVNGDEKVAGEIRTTAAIASHAAAIAESLEFQREYRASNNPESVVAKYSSLFGATRQSHHISLVYDGSTVDVLSDGEAWLSSGT